MYILFLFQFYSLFNVVDYLMLLDWGFAEQMSTLLHFSDACQCVFDEQHSILSMSWAVEEWKDGLPGKALQKIQEIEGQLDKLKKERQQKQFQLDSIEATLQKQKQKVSYLRNTGVDFLFSILMNAVNFASCVYYICLQMDSEKSEASAIKRENQSLVESCESLEKTKQKLTHDIQTKEQQVNYLEGQLNLSKKQIDRLEQEVKK